MNTVEKIALAFFILALFGIISEDGFSLAWVCLSVVAGFAFIANGGMK